MLCVIMAGFGNQCSCSRVTESVITFMTRDAGLYMVNVNACTFLWLKLLIVELWVFARYIFSICVMFSLPLWMVSVYCELPLEDLLGDQISLTQWFLLARLLHTHSDIPFSAGLGVFLGASSVTAVEASHVCQNCHYQIIQSLLNKGSLKISLVRAVSDHFCCIFLCLFLGIWLQ